MIDSILDSSSFLLLLERELGAEDREKGRENDEGWKRVAQEATEGKEGRIMIEKE